MQAPMQIKPKVIFETNFPFYYNLGGIQITQIINLFT